MQKLSQLRQRDQAFRFSAVQAANLAWRAANQAIGLFLRISAQIALSGKPEHENQLRPLVGLTTEQAQMAWEHGTEEVSGPRRESQQLHGALGHGLHWRRASLMERRRGSLARAAAAWALVRYAGLTQQTAAAALGMSTAAAVSQQLKRWQTVVSRDQSWQAILAELDQRLARANY